MWGTRGWMRQNIGGAQATRATESRCLYTAIGCGEFWPLWL